MDGQSELAISKNKFVKRIVKTSTKHNNIFLKYATTQSFQGKPIINTLCLHTLCKYVMLYCPIITLRSNHLYLIDLLTECFKQLDKCFS